jgi:hypothetical protein
MTLKPGHLLVYNLLSFLMERVSENKTIRKRRIYSKMKKQTFNKKLMLNKSTVADLNHSHMSRAKGGALVATFSMLVPCYVCESDADPCDTIYTICTCGGGGSRLCEPSVLELCEPTSPEPC